MVCNKQKKRKKKRTKQTRLIYNDLKLISNNAVVLACREPYLMRATYMLAFHPFTRFVFVSELILGILKNSIQLSPLFLLK